MRLCLSAGSIGHLSFSIIISHNLTSGYQIVKLFSRVTWLRKAGMWVRGCWNGQYQVCRGDDGYWCFAIVIVAFLANHDRKMA